MSIAKLVVNQASLTHLCIVLLVVLSSSNRQLYLQTFPDGGFYNERIAGTAGQTFTISLSWDTSTSSSTFDLILTSTGPTISSGTTSGVSPIVITGTLPTSDTYVLDYTMTGAMKTLITISHQFGTTPKKSVSIYALPTGSTGVTFTGTPPFTNNALLYFISFSVIVGPNAFLNSGNSDLSDNINIQNNADDTVFEGNLTRADLTALNPANPITGYYNITITVQRNCLNVTNSLRTANGLTQCNCNTKNGFRWSSSTQTCVCSENLPFLSAAGNSCVQSCSQNGYGQLQAVSGSQCVKNCQAAQYTDSQNTRCVTNCSDIGEDKPDQGAVCVRRGVSLGLVLGLTIPITIIALLFIAVVAYLLLRRNTHEEFGSDDHTQKLTKGNVGFTNSALVQRQG